MLLIDRGLAKTQSGLRSPLIEGACPPTLDFPFIRGVRGDEGEVKGLLVVEDLCETSSVRSLFGVKVCWTVLLDLLASLAAAADSRCFALRSRVARSGLLAVPGARYIERRFVCNSLSSAS